MTGRPEERKRNLELVGDLIDGIVSALGQKAGLGADRELWSDWEAVAGPAWAGTQPVRLEERSLIVTVPDGITATRLRYATGDLLERIATRIGPDVVTSVRLTRRSKRRTE